MGIAFLIDEVWPFFPFLCPISPSLSRLSSAFMQFVLFSFQPNLLWLPEILLKIYLSRFSTANSSKETELDSAMI